MADHLGWQGHLSRLPAPLVATASYCRGTSQERSTCLRSGPGPRAAVRGEWHEVKVQPAHPFELTKSKNSGSLGSTIKRLHPQPLFSRVSQQSTSFDIK